MTVHDTIILHIYRTLFLKLLLNHVLFKPNIITELSNSLNLDSYEMSKQ